VLLAAWLRRQLQVPVTVDVADGNPTSGIHRVVLHRATGAVRLERVQITDCP